MKGLKRASRTVGLALLMILLAIFSSGPAHGERAGGRELSVSQAPVTEHIRITYNSVQDGAAAVAYNNVRDEFLVVWMQDTGSGNYGIYAQRVSSAGSLISTAIAVDTVGYNEYPDVAYDPWSDQYLVVYDYYYATDDTDIYGQLVLGDGILLGSPQLIDVSLGLQVGAHVAYNSQDHEYLVVYASETGTGTSQYTVAGRRVGSDGVPIGTAPTTIAGTYSTWPDVAYNAALNQYLVAYQQLESGGGGARDIYARRVTNTLQMIENEFGVCVRSYSQVTPAVAAGPNEYLIAWEDSRPGTALHNTYARRVLGNGTPTGPAGGFLIGAASDALFDAWPAVAYGPNYAYLVVWTYMEGYGTVDWHWDIHGAYVIPGTDQVAGSAFGIDTTSGDQNYAQVACASSGDCLTVEDDGFYVTSGEIGGWFTRLNRICLPLALRGGP